MIAREKIRKQLVNYQLTNIANFLTLAVVVSVVATFQLWDYFWYLIAPCIIVGCFAYECATPKFPSCSEKIRISRENELGNFCKNCGISFDEIEFASDVIEKDVRPFPTASKYLPGSKYNKMLE